jgi:hypothetical protein
MAQMIRKQVYIEPLQDVNLGMPDLGFGAIAPDSAHFHGGF